MDAEIERALKEVGHIKIVVTTREWVTLKDDAARLRAALAGKEAEVEKLKRDLGNADFNFEQSQINLGNSYTWRHEVEAELLAARAELARLVADADADALMLATLAGQLDVTIERAEAERARADLYEGALNAIVDYDVRAVKRAKYIAGEDWPDFTDEVQLIAERALAAAGATVEAGDG